jgi:formiminotetrahydrofolate cyclodeaminase
MDRPIRHQTLEAFVTALAGDRPTPGSGAAAGAALALACACAAKAFAVTARRRKGDARLAAAAEAARRLADQALAGAEQDAALFEAFVHGRDRRRREAADDLAAASGDLAQTAEALAALCAAPELEVGGSLKADIDAALSLAAAAAAIAGVYRSLAEEAG